ncbi:MAG: threonylcarbamoyl-AMP synthase [Herpetosiphonaceae bacterium]|nr:MAG: threonylcarbamoyl-AMP synthase [Herpetosiphonaceae bacterium]
MSVVRVDPFQPEQEIIKRAAEIIRRGGLVAFPTETVYGLGANALDEVAVRRIFTAKGRPSYNPLIVHVGEVEEAQQLVRSWPESAEQLAQHFWPGPLTLVLPKRPEIPDLVSAGLPTVAVRMPSHPVALALLRAAAVPIAAPSANRFSEVSPTTAGHVEKSLGDRVDLILDGGPTMLGIESTVIDLSGPQPILLRPGLISTEDLAPLIGLPELPARQPSETAPRPSPGMLDRHYAPRAELRLFAPDRRKEAASLAARAVEEGQIVGALLLSALDAPIQHAIPMPHDPSAYARLLYAALHSLDDLGCHLILVEEVPATPAWAGIRDRLQRAAR